MKKERETVVSGIRPTGDLHLGNYFGAIRNYVKMQEDYDCFFFIADLHSLTTHPDTSALKDHVMRVLATYIASGIDPEKVALYCQSDLRTTGELYLFLNMLAYKGELEKTPTFKEKVRLHPENVNAGLLTYPVLMAADILIHKARYVPVGKDQEQHLEIARTYARRFNQRYTEVFPEPQAFNFNHSLLKVPSLDGSGKMSKSENENATIYLSDDDELIRKKVMRAKTDSGPTEPDSLKPDYIENLFSLMELFSAADTISHFNDSFNNCSIRYGDMKRQLAEDVIAFLSPIRNKTDEILRNNSYLVRVMKEGAARANEHADQTMSEVRRAMNLQYI